MEVNVGDKIFSSKVDVELKVVRAMDPNTFGCVEVENTGNFHAVSVNDILTHAREVDGEEEFDYKFEIDKSYFIYDPEGGQGEGEGEGEDGDGEGDEGDEESEGEPKEGDGEGEPTDEEGDGEGDGEGDPGEGEGKPGDKPGDGGESGEDNGERGKYAEGDPENGGTPAQIITSEKHPDEIIRENVKGRGKKRF